MSVRCRSCQHDELFTVLSLGATPLANALRDPARLDAAEARYPLDVVACSRCSLAQLAATVPPAVLFADYPYLSSYSDTMLRHAERMAASLVDRHGLGPQSLVVEIGSNDGYLLQYFKKAGVQILGIDPSGPACAAAAGRGIPTREAFFGSAVAEELVNDGVRASLICANNVLAHVPDLNDVVGGLRRLLTPDGVVVIETPYLKDLMDRLEFDTIYHEHVFYYSLTALDELFRRHGLTTIDVEHHPLHGGSLRVTATADRSATAGPAVAAMLAEEASWGVRSADPYQRFADRVRRAVDDLKGFLLERKRAGRRLAAYGAAAKGAMLMSALGVSDALDFVVDRNPKKQGRCLPGTRLPIFPPEHLLTAMPDDVLLFTWNLADEILSQQAEYRRRGGSFIVPIPEPRVV